MHLDAALISMSGSVRLTRLNGTALPEFIYASKRTQMIKKNKPLIVFLACAVFFFSGIAFGKDNAQGEKLWSFSFDGCAVSDALLQIQKTTNLKIVLIGESTVTADRTYKNQTLENIIRDILRNENCIMAMYPAENGPGMIKIWISGAVEDTSSFPVPRPREGIKAPPMPPG